MKVKINTRLHDGELQGRGTEVGVVVRVFPSGIPKVMGVFSSLKRALTWRQKQKPAIRNSTRACSFFMDDKQLTDLINRTIDYDYLTIIGEDINE